MPLHTKIGIGLILGMGVGVTLNIWTGGGVGVEGFVSSVTEPLGRVWLNALIMVVIPLITCTLAVGVAALGDLRRVGRIGILTLLCFIFLTTISSILGLVAVNVVRPGVGLDSELVERLLETYQDQTEGAMGFAETSFGVEFFVGMIPRNPVQAAANGEMLGVIVFAMLLGIGLTTLSKEKATPLLEVLDSLGHVTIAIVRLVMQLAPYAVFFLIFSVTARFGFDILFNLLKYVLTVIGSLTLFFVLGYSVILTFVARRSPTEFLRQTRVVVITAFSTSSSTATLPTTMQVAQGKLGISSPIAGFVLPLGATLNMNGSALFEGITVLFIAQVFGADLSLSAQAVVLVLTVVTAIGAAGIPGGSIPLLMMVLGVVGVPVEGIAIVLGVDRILDMCRTTLNVVGDLVTATVVDRFEHSMVQSTALSSNQSS